jgi:hypothetical protein
MSFDYLSWIKQAQDRLELLRIHRAAIEKEITRLEKGIEGLLPLAKSTWSGPEVGLTDAIRQVLRRENPRVFTPIEVRNALLVSGVNLGQNNPMASVHQILSRLAAYGEAEIILVNGKQGYRWKRDPLKPSPRGRLTPPPPPSGLKN